jgi:hypothetical protein
MGNVSVTVIPRHVHTIVDKDCELLKMEDIRKPPVGKTEYDSSVESYSDGQQVLYFKVFETNERQLHCHCSDYLTNHTSTNWNQRFHPRQIIDVLKPIVIATAIGVAVVTVYNGIQSTKADMLRASSSR